jgi:hypothetical protein
MGSKALHTEGELWTKHPAQIKGDPDLTAVGNPPRHCPFDAAICPRTSKVHSSYPLIWTGRLMPPGPVFVPVQIQRKTAWRRSPRTSSRRTVMSGNALTGSVPFIAQCTKRRAG